MEPDVMGGGMYSNMQQQQQPGMLGLEMSLHHQIPAPSQNPQNPLHQMPHQHHQTTQHLPMMSMDFSPSQPHQFPKPGYTSFAAKSKSQPLTLSDDDEPGAMAENSVDDGKRKVSPWQRMKWTDNMVRLLIMVVFYIGDEVGTEGANEVVVGGGSKKKSGGGGGVLQKKGKWKSVSRAMMERGFYVSPQQCEDKFNDLNKRYKRVNDILGKGTSCRVVENQSLLDTMDHVSPKLKEEVKKLLNSKHLFFREMCAYHNSCGHGGGGGGASGNGAGGVHHSPAEVSAELSHPPPQLQKQSCLHSSENVAVMPNLNKVENEVSKMSKGFSSDEDDDDDVDDEDDHDDDDDDDHDDDGGSRVHGHEDEVNETDGRSSRKRKSMSHSQLIQELDVELMNILQDGRKSTFEKTQWMTSKLIRLEEARVVIQSRAYELEKQRLKWLKFSSKKERDMEREKLTNERLKLENERMALLIRRKELDFLPHQQQHHQSSNRRGDPSSVIDL